MLLLRLTVALARARVPHAVAGGYAVALHGAVRGTVDIDLVVRLNRRTLRAVERVLNDLGLKSRLPLTAEDVAQFREEYIRNRNLTAWSFVNPERPSEIVDILLTDDLSDMKTGRIKVHGRFIRVASIEDLIRMKKKSARRQDLEDAKALESLK